MKELDNAKEVSKYWETTNWKLRTGLSLVSDTEILEDVWVRVGLIKMEQAECSPPNLGQNGDKLKWWKEWFVLYTQASIYLWKVADAVALLTPNLFVPASFQDHKRAKNWSRHLQPGRRTKQLAHKLIDS